MNAAKMDERRQRHEQIVQRLERQYAELDEKLAELEARLPPLAESPPEPRAASRPRKPR